MTIFTKDEFKVQDQELKQAVAFALEIAEKHKAQAQISISKASGLTVNSRLQEVENIEFNNDGSLGVTIFSGKNKGSSATSDLSERAIEQAVLKALEFAKYSSADDCNGLADKELLEFEPKDLDLYHETDLSIDDAIEIAIKAEKTAFATDSKITNSDGASFGAYGAVQVYGNTHGMLVSKFASRYALSCSLIASSEQGLENGYEYATRRDFKDLPSAKEIGKNAALNTVAQLDSRQIATCEVPVIYSNKVASSLIRSLSSAIGGYSIYNKSSFLIDCLGKQILPSWMQIKELPHLPKMFGSRAFDAEGVKTFDREIITDGVLQSYLFSSYSARKLNTKTTGHAGGIHNWCVKPNIQGGLDALIKQMHTGLVITEFLGSAVNLVTGEYSRGASGFWVENGEIQYPVSEITVAGKLQEMFYNIEAIADDYDHNSVIQTGSILLSKMKVAGN